MILKHIFTTSLAVALWVASGTAQERTPSPTPYDFAKQELDRRYRFKQRYEEERARKAALAQSDYDAAHYDLDLTIDPTAETVSGTVRARIVPLVPSLAVVELDLYDNMAVSEVRENGTSVVFSHSNDILAVTLSGSYAVGDTVDVEVDYAGQPATGGSNEIIGSDAFVFATHGLTGASVIYNISEPFFARVWWPCKDIPADKATATLSATVPDTLVVASNGLLTGTTDLGNGWKRFDWTETYPITTYLVSVAISNYVVMEDYYTYSPTDSLLLQYFVFPQDTADARVDFSNTAAMVDRYSTLFGEYPFIDEKYGMAEVLFGGALEHQTCTSYGSRFIRGNNGADWAVAHELAHSWWGNSLSPQDWPEVWLNEGFANYCEALWFESVGGYQAYIDWIAEPVKRPTGGYRGTLYNPSSLFSVPDVYWRGAWVLHMLRGVMGDAAFFDAFRAYGATFAYGNATTAAFQAVCESEYGGSLDWFFQQFVFGWSEPVYQYSWVTTPRGSGDRAEVIVRQLQETGLVTMPIDLQFSLTSGDSIITVWNDRGTQSYAFVFDEPVTGVAFDPNTWLLKTVSQAPVNPKPNASVHPNPFNGRTTISFETSVPGSWEIKIYDVNGKKIRDLGGGQVPAGLHTFEWDGRNGAGHEVASGVYFVRLQTPQGESLARAVFLK